MATALGASFSCSAADLKAVQSLVGDAGLASTVCSRVDVAAAGTPMAAVLQHLAATAAGAAGLEAAAETGHSVNTSFLLFSGYLVFMMQAGFALVSPRPGPHHMRA